MSKLKKNKLSIQNAKIAVIGLGYVGLPLAVEFGKQISVVGYDINKDRIAELKNGFDSTLEVEIKELNEAKSLTFTNNIEDMLGCNVFIVTVPTPINEKNDPDLKPLILASELVGKIIKSGDVVIYESTVYPGATEEECVPILEHFSGLKFNIDFFVGYSPERINPGDKSHRLIDIMKVTSGSLPHISDFVDNLYLTIIKAGTYRASSIRVAEAAKVIENTQRDVNIALINELSIIFNKLDIDTNEVLAAAGTKWNFLPFRPGLVGGHCIGVDPYYLTHKSSSVGYDPAIILAGRHINDDMGRYVAIKLIEKMKEKKMKISKSRALIMGLTFKENCPDIRNTKVVDIIDELKKNEVNVDIIDPWCDPTEASNKYGLEIIKHADKKTYDCIVLAVAHQKFKEMGIKNIRQLGKPEGIIYDLKCIFEKEDVDMRL